VVGYYSDASGHYQGFSEQGGVYTPVTENNPLPLPGTGEVLTDTMPTGVSGGIIVGAYRETAPVDSGGAEFGFEEQGGAYVDLDILDPAISGSTVVGWDSFGSEHVPEGVIEADGLSTLVAEPSAGVGVFRPGTWLTGIDGDEVVGYYRGSDDLLHGFIATGVPEPASIGTLAIGVAWLLVGRRRVRR
jgi:hypothetical protein